VDFGLCDLGTDCIKMLKEKGLRLRATISIMLLIFPIKVGSIDLLYVRVECCMYVISERASSYCVYCEIWLFHP